MLSMRLVCVKTDEFYPGTFVKEIAGSILLLPRIEGCFGKCVRPFITFIIA